jgi:hypothetical protein
MRVKMSNSVTMSAAVLLIQIKKICPFLLEQAVEVEACAWLLE